MTTDGERMAAGQHAFAQGESFDHQRAVADPWYGYGYSYSAWQDCSFKLTLLRQLADRLFPGESQDSEYREST